VPLAAFKSRLLRSPVSCLLRVLLWGKIRVISPDNTSRAVPVDQGKHTAHAHLVIG
jgi:hypothetical protein